MRASAIRLPPVNKIVLCLMIVVLTGAALSRSNRILVVRQYQHAGYDTVITVGRNITIDYQLRADSSSTPSSTSVGKAVVNIQSRDDPRTETASTNNHRQKIEQETGPAAVRQGSHRHQTPNRHQQNVAGSAVPTTFGLVVAHCDEDYLTWINAVEQITLKDENSATHQQTSWDVAVYERCDKREHINYSIPQENLGSEECSAYVQYVLDRYDDHLPEIVYFLQPDALAPNTMKDNHQHTAFNTMQALVDVSAPLLLRRPHSEVFSTDGEVPSSSITTEPLLKYLNLANDTEMIPKLVMEDGSKIVEILALMGERAPHYDSDTRLRYISGACFAVRRERIHANPRQFYEDLMELIHRYAPEDERWICWALESLWHVVLGEPLQVPEASTLSFRPQ